MVLSWKMISYYDQTSDVITHLSRFHKIHCACFISTIWNTCTCVPVYYIFNLIKKNMCAINLHVMH